uniref:Uncharacterized protein n=1 Tax=Cannabis sativa TaxID=3483 RepID=A0A803R492_CANSA
MANVLFTFKHLQSQSQRNWFSQQANKSIFPSIADPIAGFETNSASSRTSSSSEKSMGLTSKISTIDFVF